ncbi:MAG: 6-carboxytetrahydropterin synthase QueD [Candidatus Omnitrophica bacterium]|nr:6-carboxytetrahydropterin synthase QueD [Candidatus Omnitrophota bacterium]
MYSIKVEEHFSAAHNLRGYRGKCEELHGHNWKVEAVVSCDKLDKTGMAMDFKHLKAALNKILEKLDHKYLNGISYFKKANPTSENIASYIYERLKPQVKALSAITVWESENACATYSE